MAFIYGLWDPRRPLYLEEVRYVGQTTKSLQQCLERHIASALQDPDLGKVNEWLLNLMADGHIPTMLPLDELPTRHLNAAERKWVNRGRSEGWPLLNVQVGGRAHRGRHGPKPRTPEEAYWKHVIVNEGECWGWRKAPGSFGYGTFTITVSGQRTNYTAHRFSWELHRGPIPDGLYVCHACDNPPCSNPDHLWLGTHDENQKDAAAKGRMRNGRENQTHCHKGHPLSGENMYLHKGRRHCRECRREHDRKVYRERQESLGLTVAPRNSERTHCPQGHPYSPENTYTDKRGCRQCKQCHKDRQIAKRKT